MEIKAFGTTCALIFFTVVSYSQVVLTRGPYLQVGTSNSMTIRWRTDAASAAKVSYGTSATSLNMFVENTNPAVEHELTLSGLSPQTKYWYKIEAGTQLLQGDAENYFYTLPITGSRGLLRIGVLGDCGNNSTNQLNVRNQLINYLDGNYMTAWLLLGDNAYANGTGAQYQSNFFNIYKDRFLKQNPLYPSPGNHDYDTGGPLKVDRGNVPYHSLFSMPINGEAGGYPSHNKAFYSFDIGNVHFLSLDSYGREADASKLYDVNGVQATWIKQDLAANANKEWIIAYWHHPPYSQGSRNSEAEADMIAIRENFIRILEDNGVDLILCGHSHVYERSRLITGHYGYEASFNASQHNVSNSSALYQDANSCPYIKKNATGNRGTVYVVSGSAGQLGGASPGYPHNAMYYSNNSNGGALMLEIEASRLDLKWINADGGIRDRFTMMKEVGNRHTYHLNLGQSIELKASYIGNYTWSTTENEPAIIATPTIEGTNVYTVKDNFDCITDTFDIVASAVLPVDWGSIKGWHNLKEKANYLEWETLRERGNNSFSIERSENGIDFYHVGNQPAAASPDQKQVYRYIDRSLIISGRQYYYRIKQTDIDGRFDYSAVVKIKSVASLSALEMIIQPNPANSDNMQISLTENYNGKIQVLVTNVVGKIVLQKNFLLNKHPQRFLPKVLPGVYIVTATAADFKISRSVVIY